MAEKNNAKLPDLATLLQAGIDPKTGLPIRLASNNQMNKDLKYKARRVFRIIDEQRAVNRYVWYNLPAGLSSQELERLLYFKYSLVFFYMKELDKFFFMPYALDGTIDFYGRFNTVHPVPMTSGSEKEEQSDEYKQKAALLSTLKLNVVKDVVIDISEINEDLLTKSGVILRDYTNQLGQLGEARWILNDDIIEAEADCLPFMRLNLLLGTGVQGLRVPDADSALEADAVSRQFYAAALNGNPYLAITAAAEFQELQPASTQKTSEFFLAMQSLDNILLSTYGIDNTGMYEKKAHILESENQVNANNVSLVLQDGLTQRQNFCNIINSIWGFNVWCEINETLLGYDVDGDGVNYEESDEGAGSGFSTEEGGEE
jgi:hypothetical protein